MRRGFCKLARFESTNIRHSSSQLIKTWKMCSYGAGIESLKFKTDDHIPQMSSPNDILIKVHSSSVNPIDLRMIEGYGRSLLNVYRRIDQCAIEGKTELPLTLGRDCSGTVVDTGRNVTKFQPGDEVWCAIGAEKQGCFSEYLIADDNLVDKKPANLSHTEAALIPYVACTVWAALCTVGRMHDTSRRRLSVLIHGGSGGIGTFAIQLAKTFRAKITTTCSKDADELVRKLGADCVVDYKETDAYEKLTACGPFDIILDSVDTPLSRQSISLLGLWRGSVHVNICNPLLRNADTYGFWAGLVQSAFEFSSNFITHALDGRLSIWAYVNPNAKVLETVRQYIENNDIKPIVHSMYKLEDLPKALHQLSEGKVRGKIAINMTT